MSNSVNAIETYTGLFFDVLNPRESDICIEDIAHSLSLISRFGGHCTRHYSVAQHSVLVHEAVLNKGNNIADDKNLRLAALLHDATEAYIGDLPRPIKLAMPQYIELEKRLWNTICNKFGIKYTPEVEEEVKRADNLLLKREAESLMKSKGKDWNGLKEVSEIHFPAPIYPTWPEYSEKLFLRVFYEIERLK